MSCYTSVNTYHHILSLTSLTHPQLWYFLLLPFWTIFSPINLEVHIQMKKKEKKINKRILSSQNVWTQPPIRPLKKGCALSPHKCLGVITLNNPHASPTKPKAFAFFNIRHIFQSLHQSTSTLINEIHKKWTRNFSSFTEAEAGIMCSWYTLPRLILEGTGPALHGCLPRGLHSTKSHSPHHPITQLSPSPGGPCQHPHGSPITPRGSMKIEINLQNS